ncbi:ribonuclease HII [Salinicoccus albus]|uniref:ribonuclease HII n=1 Tax=Salinicoccus albus TaxID=418756 RepID=UPI000361018A
MKTVTEIKAEIAGIKSLTQLESCEFINDTRKGVILALKKQRRLIEKEQLLIEKYEKMSTYENNLRSNHPHIAGVDEAGRGPIAGEVVAAAVVLPEGFRLIGLDDSKKLSSEKRMSFRKIIMQEADYAVGVASVIEIENLNIYEASRLAMGRAVQGLQHPPHHLLVDAMTVGGDIPETSIIKGDSNSVSIAAASVIAKTERDLMMEAYDQVYPGYNFKTHKGYGTKSHLKSLDQLGTSPIHRKTFEPVKKYIDSQRIQLH